MEKHTLTEWRRLKNVSQDQLADAINVHRVTLAKWELGKHKMNITAAVKACDFLGISLDQVIFLTEDAT